MLSITELHKKLQESEKIKDSEFNEFIELVIYSLLVDKSSFFGAFLIKLTRRIDRKVKAPAAVSLRPSGFTLHLNPELLVPFTIDEITAIIIHEIYHIVNNHLIRAKKHPKVEHEAVNIAMDCSINQYIENLPEGTITLKYLDMLTGKDLDAKREYEYYLDELVNSDAYKEHQERMNKLNSIIDDILDELEKNGGKSPNEGQSTADWIEEKLNENGLSLGDLVNNHDNELESNSFDMDPETARRLVSGMVNDALSSSRGVVPVGLERAVELLNTKPFITWQQELKRMVGSIQVPYKRTFLRRSRRLPNRPDIRGRMMDREVSITVAIDTSGSQSEKQLTYIFNEVFHILKGTKHNGVRIIECDSEVGRDYRIKSHSDINLNEVTGGGGTALSPVIELLNKDKGRNKTDLLVYFTDGYAEPELTEPPQGYRVMWVLIDGSDRISLEEPHGVVRKFISGEENN